MKTMYELDGDGRKVVPVEVLRETEHYWTIASATAERYNRKTRRYEPTGVERLPKVPGRFGGRRFFETAAECKAYYVSQAEARVKRAEVELERAREGFVTRCEIALPEEAS